MRLLSSSKTVQQPDWEGQSAKSRYTGIIMPRNDRHVQECWGMPGQPMRQQVTRPRAEDTRSRVRKP